jgi:hypothetical protein
MLVRWLQLLGMKSEFSPSTLSSDGGKRKRQGLYGNNRIIRQNVKVQWKRVRMEYTPIRITTSLVASILLPLFVSKRQPTGTVFHLSFETLMANSRIPCRAPAVLRPCRLASVFSRPWHSTAGVRYDVWINNGRLSTACGPLAQLRFLPATARSYTKAVLTALISHKLTSSWVLPREIPIVIDEEKLTVFVQEHGTDPTFSK